ncbi:MAG: serine hydrolase [Eubacteriales bacterium]|nr:serine hydrolase [Eubacteriales bacterium]
MNYKNRWKYFSLLLSACLTCAFPFSAAAMENKTDSTAAQGSVTDIWPDLYEVNMRIMEHQNPGIADTPPVAPRNHAFTQEELDDLFGELPFTFDTGSLMLNELNGLWESPSDQKIQVTLSNGEIITRPSWTSLEKEITDRLASCQGDWSVYIKDLSTQKVMEINEHSMESASLIKLYIAGTIYEQLDWGNLEETETIMNALNLMITVSDNESSNVLVRQLYDENGSFQDGLDIVNDFIRRHGFTNTQQVNGIADPSLWVSDGSVNMTSTADCGRLLEAVYNRELVSHFNSYRFEVLLNKQEVNYKIPDGLPSGVHISHKTGEVDDTENDAAIIYTPYGDYIFCIMSTDLTDTGSAVDHIHDISALVYDYFTTNTNAKEQTVPDSVIPAR